MATLEGAKLIDQANQVLGQIVNIRQALSQLHNKLQDITREIGIVEYGQTGDCIKYKIGTGIYTGIVIGYLTRRPWDIIPSAIVRRDGTTIIDYLHTGDSVER